MREQNQPKRGSNILLVENDPQVRMLMRALLRDAGFSAQSAADAHEALRLMDEKGSPDVLVSNVRLPGLSGAELIEIARTRWPELPGVLVSDAASVAEQARTTALGVFFCAKPFSSDELLAAVAEALRWRGGTA